MISTDDKVIGLVSEEEVTEARKGAPTTKALFNPKYLRQALEILEKMDCGEVEVELANNQPIFFKPKQYKPSGNKNDNIFGSSVISIVVCDMGE